MDHIEEMRGFASLVRLQRSDKVKLRVREALAQSRPLARTLLHVVLAKNSLACRENRLDGLGRKRFRDRHQRHGIGFAPAIARGPGHGCTNFGEPPGIAGEVLHATLHRVFRP
jgi:hypothetical protein